MDRHMTKKKAKPNTRYNSAFWVNEAQTVSFTDNYLEELADICEDLCFTDELIDLAKFYKANKINHLESSTTREKRAALLEIESITDQLVGSLSNIDTNTKDLICEASQNNITHAFLKSLVKNDLRLLVGSVEMARRMIEKETGRPHYNAERALMIELHRVFSTYDIELSIDESDGAIGITGFNFYAVAKIILKTAWPLQTEWPEKRKYTPFKESTVHKQVSEYLASLSA